MIRVSTFAGRNVAVVGLGSSGLTAARALADGGAKVACWDDSEAARVAAGKADAPVEDIRETAWARFDALVLAPGIPLTHPEPHWAVRKARAAGVEIIGDVELYARERAKVAPEAPFVAITGTNGKSTTTALTAHILRSAGRDVQMGGNIGTAVLALQPPAADRCHVIEMSSFQIELTPTLAPTVGILLKMVESLHEKIGAIISGLLGTAWTVITYFVVPVLVVERVGPFAAIGRSLAILRKTWGEAVVGHFGIGFFTFLRKLGGAGAVALALFALDLAGFAKDQPQTETTLFAIRVLTAGVPGVFVLLAAWVALLVLTVDMLTNRPSRRRFASPVVDEPAP